MINVEGDSAMPDLTDYVVQFADPDSGKVGVFTLTLPAGVFSSALKHQMQNMWELSWRRAGYDRVPVLLILSDDMKLSALADAELTAAGLLRIDADGGP